MISPKKRSSALIKLLILNLITKAVFVESNIDNTSTCCGFYCNNNYPKTSITSLLYNPPKDQSLLAYVANEPLVGLTAAISPSILMTKMTRSPANAYETIEPGPAECTTAPLPTNKPALLRRQLKSL